MSRRVLVTGSRDWPDPKPIVSALNSQWLKAHRQGRELVVVQGECPSGADRFAAEWAEVREDTGLFRVKSESYPADWSRDCDERCTHAPRWKHGRRYCPLAGHLRNQKMVDMGADICIAFPLKDSRGTWDCIKRARRAGISVINFGFDGPLCAPSINYHIDPHTGPCALAR
ncbi:SLOG family protein [Mycobacteroides abscessus]|uniref:SLOG family protein n=1 Tax=Mycobacteroides abscessus TaxID=36809 RepID=UPI000C2688E5|nr:SLOG family protein [Mycobacteroides abscessus]